MAVESKARFTALGAYVPSKRLTNHDLEGMVDTSDEWILQRTGIKERRQTEQDVYASHLAIEAVKDLAEQPGVTIDDVGLVLVTTITPDFLTPSVAAMVQGAFGFENAGAIDLNAACAGFVYGLCVANALITVGQQSKILVVASEVLSKITNYTDRTTCILFGDGAAAALVEASPDEPSFIATHFGSDGHLGDRLYCPNLSSHINGKALSSDVVLHQDGRAVYTWAINNVPKGMRALVEKAQLELGELDWFIPHSANLRMIKSICKKMDFPMEKTLTSMEQFGNTSSVTIPLALWLALREGKVKRGDRLALYGFGGGLTQAGTVLRW
jgi:3-oxoacyl-[acyl-carrier-protein] synthase-3